MKRVVLVSMVVVLGLIACREPAPEQSVTPVTLEVEALPSCSKIVTLKDSYYTKPEAVIEISYIWTTGMEFKGFDKDYMVAAHLESASGQLVWIEDHMPSPPTSQWKPGKTYRYSDVIRVPNRIVDPRINFMVGLYDRHDLADRRYFAGESGKVRKKLLAAKFYIQPEERELYREGWGPLEFGMDGSSSWRWFTNRALYSFRNPGQYSFLAINGSTLKECFSSAPTLSITVNDEELERMEVIQDRFEKVYPMPLDMLGIGDWCDVLLAMDQSFSPSECSGADDDRQLSMMINGLEVRGVDYTSGWYAPELSRACTWRWCGADAVISMGNPHSDAVIAIDGETNLAAMGEAPTIQVFLDDALLDEYIPDSDRIDRIYTVPAADFGDEPLVALHLRTDRTFKPAQSEPDKTDDRELALRIKSVAILKR
ncbi:hypothetical protein JW905_08580 [bacterium]|nr:hypothetical protein [candidate division CSSED10-310 bacterium]